MELNEAMAREIARQLGLKDEGTMNMETLRRLEGKSDSELEREILRLRQQLAAKGIAPSRQASMLRSLMPMMEGKQKARLPRVIELIER